MITYLCMKYESNTPMFSKDIARKPFSYVRTYVCTDVRTRVMLYAPPPPPHYKWRGHKKALHDVRYNRVSKKWASLMYGVPRTTLVRRLTTFDPTSPATRQPALSRNEEDEPVSHIL